MPNWCRNRVTVYSDAKEPIEKITKIFENKKNVFGQIIQEPDWSKLPNEKGEFSKLVTHRGKDGEIIFETHEFPDGKNDDRWYHWCISNWGTKWDLSELTIDYDDSEQLELEFSTAWSPPEGIMQELKDRYPDLGFTCFYDEPGMEAAGYY